MPGSEQSYCSDRSVAPSIDTQFHLIMDKMDKSDAQTAVVPPSVESGVAVDQNAIPYSPCHASISSPVPHMSRTAPITHVPPCTSIADMHWSF